ncbi:NosD domain-containing protein [Anaerobaca lacustris]|uniref:Probable pectate lyase C n=1 Tax=Anaerobaca lacustris TaxID=3044600 RepID=A0AAW6TTS3_9BACT|nr:NosD domain-containing protein [Sedimentisphaerales bacterium M17dextr]
MNRLVVLLIVSVLTIPAAAGTIYVDGNGAADHQTIQQAIDASWDGDVIVVRPGTYAERVTFNGRAVTVRSEDPDDPTVVEATVIAGPSEASVIFDFGEGSQSVLTGFTITGYGILCVASAPTISKNVIRDCTGSGIAGESDAAPTIVGNTIVFNELEGVFACNGLIQGNTISYNSAGAAYCHGTIRDNLISYNVDAGGLYFCNGPIVGNRIVGNVAFSDGGGLYICDGPIENNVIAGNRATGEGGGLYGCMQRICNNTIVGNIAGTYGGALSRCMGTVCNNILAFNQAPSAAGIYGPCTNSYNAFWMNDGGNFGGNATLGAGDFVADPLFAVEGRWDDNGTPEIDDDVWIDGDYHLRSQIGRWDPAVRRWVADSETSQCIDAGAPDSDFSAELWPHGRHVNVGAYGGTAQASMSLSDTGHPADLNHDGRIGPDDLALFVDKWVLQEDLLAEDLDRDGSVDFRDFVTFADAWGSTPPAPAPPTPNPMTWATPPYGTGPYSIAMVATVATSVDGTEVEYYFENTQSPEFNSGWVTFPAGQEPRWEQADLQPMTLYWYRVKARNRGNRLETDWSETARASTLQDDTTAPTPTPMTWETEPYGSSSNSIRMVATEATDASGVEYQFECTSHPAYSSGWQDSRIYEVTSVPHGHYTFEVRARDKSPNQNTTLFSLSATADLQPPTPDPMRWQSEPKEVNIGGGSLNYYATMTAVEAVDERADVEYFFECTTESGFSSKWQSSREYSVLIGRSGQGHRFRVKARDTSPGRNETGWSSVVMAR